MQIKAIETKDYISSQDIGYDSTSWVLETNSFLIDVVSLSCVEDALRLRTKFPDFYDPFGYFDEPKPNDPKPPTPPTAPIDFTKRSVVVVRSEDQTPYTTILINCSVYVTNSAGKTVDSCVAGNI